MEGGVSGSVGRVVEQMVSGASDIIGESAMTWHIDGFVCGSDCTVDSRLAGRIEVVVWLV